MVLATIIYYYYCHFVVIIIIIIIIICGHCLCLFPGIINGLELILLNTFFILTTECEAICGLDR